MLRLNIMPGKWIILICLVPALPWRVCAASPEPCSYKSYSALPGFLSEGKIKSRQALSALYSPRPCSLPTHFSDHPHWLRAWMEPPHKHLYFSKLCTKMFSFSNACHIMIITSIYENKILASHTLHKPWKVFNNGKMFP